MTDNYFLKECVEAKDRGASKEYCERMKFLSIKKGTKRKIDNWVKIALDNSWFGDNKSREIILSKAIQAGIQIAIDIQKEESKRTVNNP